MAERDVTARPHPADLFLPLVDRFDAITAAVGPSTRSLSPAAFAGLPLARELLQDVDPAAATEYQQLLYAVWRFHVAGRPVRHVTRAALAPRLVGDPTPATPADACYVQLPTQWFWAQAQADGPHEPFDGIFVTPFGREVHLLGILGFRPGRDGVTTVGAHARQDDFGTADAIVRTPRFAPAMAAGDTAGFASVTSVGELVLLASLALSVVEA